MDRRTLCITLFFLLLPVMLVAGELRYTIEFPGYHRQGHTQHGIVPLKKVLHQQFPGINLNGHRLKKVILFAGSRHGRGQARIRTGSQLSPSYRIPRFRGGRHHGSPPRTVLHGTSVTAGGPWQILLNGRIRLDKAVVVLKEPRRHRREHQRPWHLHAKPHRPFDRSRYSFRGW